MKVSPEDFAKMEAAIKPLDLNSFRVKYAAGDYPRAELTTDVNVRYRWDLFWASKVSNQIEGSYDSDHLDTALRRIVPNIIN